MKTGDAGRALIKEFEGFSPEPYLCPAGLPTIGYGSLFDDGVRVTMGHRAISEDEAEALLAADLKTAESGVSRLVSVPLAQNQFDALVSFAYNLGAASLMSSTLLRKLNAGDYNDAADELPRWVYAGGRVLPGLVRRRNAEQRLFLS